MNIILWIVFGAIAGAIASFIMKSSLGIIGDIIVGIVGAVIGGFLVNLISPAADYLNTFSISSLIVAVIGAVVLLAILRAVGGRRVAA